MKGAVSAKSQTNTYSWVDPDMILGKKLSVVKDLNPEIDETKTLFQLNLARMEGENPIIDVGTSPMQVINAQIELILDGSARRNIAGKRNKTEPTLIDMNRLSSPKGVKRVCEVCPKRADYCCCNCLVTFYCSLAHRYKDCVHGMICCRLRIIRNPSVHKSNKVDRRRIIGQRSYVMVKLIDDFVRQALGFLYEDKYEEAILTLHHSLKLLPQVYNYPQYLRQVIIVYTISCEAKIGQKDLKGAESMLKKAISTLFKTEDLFGFKPLNYTRALIHKAQAMLLYALGNMEDAIFYFSEYIYFITKELGPYHVRNCMGYFNLARSFMKDGKKQTGFKIISFCADLWLEYLYSILKSSIMRTSVGGMAPAVVQSEDAGEQITFVTEIEMRKNLKECWWYVNEESHPKTTCKIILCEGILQYVYKLFREAKDSATRSLRLARQVEDKELLMMSRHLQKHAGRRDTWKK